jgi:hypothetical protein
LGAFVAAFDPVVFAGAFRATFLGTGLSSSSSSSSYTAVVFLGTFSTFFAIFTRDLATGRFAGAKGFLASFVAPFFVASVVLLLGAPKGKWVK